jgi:hypothetical protein
MKYRSIAVWLFLFSYVLTPVAAQNHVPSEGEVKVALQSLIVATTATAAGQRFDPPLVFSDAQFTSDPSISYFMLTLDECDIGKLRERVLVHPLPQVRQMGFLEALFSSMIPLFPDVNRMMNYLRAQALLSEEVASPYPFRYEGEGSCIISGSRIAEPFSLDISFVMPLEGPALGAIIPTLVLANGEDYLSTAQSLFPLPSYVQVQDELHYLQ